MPPQGLYGLTAWRERRGLSIDELATGAGVTVGTLKRLERGATPSYRSARALADALDVEPHWLHSANQERLQQGARRSPNARAFAREIQERFCRRRQSS